MKKIPHVVYTAVILVVILLEALPFGAVLNFMPGPNAEIVRRTYSYFDPTPYGYANFGPLLTAILSVGVLVLLLTAFFIRRPGLGTAAFVMNILAVLTSLCPLLYGIRYCSVVGMLISGLLILALLPGVLAVRIASRRADPPAEDRSFSSGRKWG